MPGDDGDWRAQARRAPHGQDKGRGWKAGHYACPSRLLLFLHPHTSGEATADAAEARFCPLPSYSMPLAKSSTSSFLTSDKGLYVNQSCVFLGFKENGQDDQQSGQRPLADVGPAAALPPLKGGVFPFQACLGTRRLSHEPHHFVTLFQG
jgi:hypothetical protein